MNTFKRWTTQDLEKRQEVTNQTPRIVGQAGQGRGGVTACRDVVREQKKVPIRNLKKKIYLIVLLYIT